MRTQDKTAFAQLILTTANKYNRPFTENFLEIYWHCLKQFSLSDIQQAFVAHFKNTDNGHFMPQPSDIIRILQGDSQTQALQAWSKVMRAIQCVGIYQSIVFDDFLIHVVISDMQGWTALGYETEQELKFRSHEFRKRYCGYLLRRPRQYPNRLIGILEHQNQVAGYAIPPPKLFGDEQAAFLTYSEGCEPHQLCSQKVTSLSEMLASLPSHLNAKAQNLLTEHEKNDELLKPNINQPTFSQATTDSTQADSINPNTRSQSDEK